MDDISLDSLFFDMNCYFASVCQAEEPHLRGRPVGVVTTDAPGAACIAVSVEAKQRGLEMGIRERDARAVCPDIVFREARHDLFVDYHHRIRDAVETVLPIDRVHSIDECSCRLMGAQRALPRALAVGAEVQAVIKRRVSPALRCSVGLGPNVLLAKTAAELRKPEGLEWLSPEVMPGRISHLQMEELPGISFAMMHRLLSAGIRTVPQLYALDPKAARHIWGSVEGERFLTQLRGGTVVYPEARRHSLSHSQILTPRNRSPEGARLVARRLLVKAAARLRRERRFARGLHVGAKEEGSGYRHAEGRIAPTRDTLHLLRTFERYWRRLPVARPVAVMIGLTGLLDESEHMGDLFIDRPVGGDSLEERLCRSIDRLNARFGQDAVRFGELPPHKVAYTGAKIAFGRIPDRREFRE